MPRSMTGYGRASLQRQDWSVAWELRSVNSRHLDLKWRLPLFLRSKEAAWERVVREKAKRGRLELMLHVTVHKPELLGISLNAGLAKAMFDQLQLLAESMQHDYAPDLNRVLSMPQLWEDDLREPDPELVADVERALGQALGDWNASRGEEGHALMADLAGRLETMHGLAARIKERLPQARQEKFDAMQTRIQNMLDRFAIDMDQERLLQEVALLSDRLDVSEELTRLDAHLERLAQILQAGGETGKRLDFTLQECFREINTLGNKSQDAVTSQDVVEFKAELEKCREQVQNLE